MLLSENNTVYYKNIIIFGETHSNFKEIQDYFSIIEKFKPEFYLHELLYEDICITQDEIKKRLYSCSPNNLCDPTLNKHIYEFGYKNNLKLVGIDLNSIPNRESLSLKETFKIREAQMLKIIDAYAKYRICVQLGDTHLRTITTAELGPKSPIYEKYKNLAHIIRSKTGEIK